MFDQQIRHSRVDANISLCKDVFGRRVTGKLPKLQYYEVRDYQLNLAA